MNFDIHRLTDTASTNDDARQAAVRGAPEGTVIWALSQSSGRGRHGRQWSSPAGNLYCSVILRPSGDISTYGQYSFVAALALADTVQSELPWALTELKWPNDVLVKGKKISGILLESGEGFLIIGMGLNVLHTPENPLYPATSLNAEGSTPLALDAVLADLLHNLDQRCGILRAHGFGPIRAAWLSRARKGPMRVRLPEGEIHGEFADLDEKGNLHLLLPDGAQRCIHTGDVFF